ncbi:hypothetical protein PL78_03390 [Yersinia entomophaga]|uniref:HNH nuclease domain-containing protein n=1 Tax=Yersinia entomophaga TaxID=935293 RepID=A0ABN4PNL1_YERET|nr:DUF968 domain-containing protein [Yersinia entomophaga]ANI28885.1 hypothetical protein PL78_03390 [Yersinia entomophaga]OWF85531.1 hypothetical protein B4914_17225 [Yersinia entomophaga]
MRALLTPFIQRELGVVIFKPGPALLPYMSGRLLVATEPDEFKSLPAGLLPVENQQLANDPRLAAFFRHERVISAVGGRSALKEWVERKGECQWQDKKGYHDKNLTLLEYDGSAICLCWHCDHKVREKTLKQLDTIAAANLQAWVVDSANRALSMPSEHQLTLPEFCWWSVLAEVYDLLPDAIARVSLKMPAAKIETGGTKESDITWSPAPAEIIEAKVKPVLALKVDPEPPASFMLRPKRQRWENRKYLQWVKSQPCCGCGHQADDPHHIIGHGQGGMATKSHDLFTIPLCRQCHDGLHRDQRAWERQHGSQIVLLFKFLDHSIAIGALA